MWKVEVEVEAARKMVGWGAFHRACATSPRPFYFDHPERVGGRRGEWIYDCFTTVGRQPVRLSQGRGKTVLEALADAHEKSGRATEVTRGAFAAIGGVDLLGGAVAAVAGGAVAVDSFEDLIG